MNFFLYLAILLTFSGCTSQQWKIVTPQEEFGVIGWQENELASDIAKRTLKVDEGSSHHIIRLRTAEEPHVHDDHDLTAFILSGKARVIVGHQVVTVEKGDVVDIPRGTVHWAENLGREACEVYVIFTPPFDGKDHRVINP